MYDFIQREELLELLEAATTPLLKRIADLEALGDEYVDTKTALRILGVGKSWLERERHKPGTLLVVSYAGSKPTYSRSSLYAAKAARTPKIHNTNPQS